MGRQSRQARRAQERRQQLQAERGPRPSRARTTGPARGAAARRGDSRNWSILAGAAVILAALVLFALSATHVIGGQSSASPTSTPTIPNGPAVAGIQCDQGMTTSNSFHIHAHLDIFDKGKPVVIPQDYGHYINRDCLYWLHAHDTQGIIHIESPSPIHPTLATWYQIAKNTLPEAGDSLPRITPRAGEKERVWVNLKPYHGDPMKIVLTRHKDITIEFGPPWVKPKRFKYPSGY